MCFFLHRKAKFGIKRLLKDTKVEKLVVICGHYKGIDQRVIDKYVTDEYSIGDFVMSCGEIPAMMMIDSIVRLQPGVLKMIVNLQKQILFPLNYLIHHFTLNLEKLMECGSLKFSYLVIMD